MKKLLLLAGILWLSVCVVGMLFAAGQQEGGGAAKQVTVRILTRNSNPNVPRQKFFIDSVSQFEKENPNINLEDWSINNEDTFNNKYKTAIASGDPIEVFVSYGYAQQLEYVKNEIYTDLTPIFEKDPEYYNSFNEGLFSPWIYESFGIDGIYAVPENPYGVAFYYNQKVFDTLGLEVPSTWQDVRNMTPKLTAEEITPVAFGAKEHWRGGHFLTCLSMKRYGSELKDQLISHETKWNDEEVVGLIEFMKTLKDEGVFGTDNLAYDNNGEYTMLQRGEAAMNFNGTWLIPTVNSFDNVDDIHVILFPAFEDYPENKDNWMGGPAHGYAISSKPGDDDYEASVKVLKYFTNKDYQIKMREASGGSGMYSAKLPPAEYLDHITKEFTEIFNQAEDMIGEIEQYSPMSQLMDTVRYELQTLFAGDDPQIVADRIQQEVDTYWSNK